MTNLEKENKNLKLASVSSTLVAAASIVCFCLAANSSNKHSDALLAEQYDHAETISMWKVSTDLAREFQARNAELLAQKNGGKVIEILKEESVKKVSQNNEEIATFHEAVAEQYLLMKVGSDGSEKTMSTMFSNFMTGFRNSQSLPLAKYSFGVVGLVGGVGAVFSAMNDFYFKAFFLSLAIPFSIILIGFLARNSLALSGYLAEKAIQKAISDGNLNEGDKNAK